MEYRFILIESTLLCGIVSSMRTLLIVSVVVVLCSSATAQTWKKHVVMEQGQIIERGNHEDLLALNGRYARLFELQAQGYR